MQGENLISVFINPVSGGGAGSRLYDALEKRRADDPFLKKHIAGIFFTPLPGNGVATRDALNAAPTALICGGDGTVHHMVNLIKTSGQNRRISVFPLGTGNDFALNLGSGETDIFRHLRRLIDRPTAREVDIFSLNGRVFFTNYASFGLDAHILSLHQSAVRRVGRLLPFPFLRRSLYLPVGLWAFVTYGKKVADGEKSHTCVIAANLRTYAGGSVISQTSSPADGMMELVPIDGKGAFLKLVLSRYFPALHPNARSSRPPLSIRTRGDSPVQVDGEDYSAQFAGTGEFTITHEGSITVCI